MPTQRVSIEELSPDPQRISVSELEPVAKEQSQEVGTVLLDELLEFGPEILGGLGFGLMFGPLAAVPGAMAGNLSKRATSGFEGEGVLDFYQKTSDAMQRNILGEAGGRLAISGIQRAPLGRITSASGRQAMDWIERAFPARSVRERIFGRRDVGVSLAHLTSDESMLGRFIDFLGNISEGGLLGGQIRRLTQSTTSAVRDLAEATADRYGRLVDKQQLGAHLMEILSGNVRPGKLTAAPIYNEIIERTAATANSPGLTIPTSRLRKLIGGVLKRGEATQSLKVLDEALAGTDSIPFSKLLEIRDLVGKQFSELPKDDTSARLIVSRIHQLLQAETRRSLAQFDGQLAGRLKQADSILLGEGDKALAVPFIQSLVRAANPKLGGTPEALVDVLMKNRDNATNLALLRNSLKGAGEEEWAMFQGYVYRQLIADSGGSGAKLLELVEGVGPGAEKGIGVTALQVIFEDTGLSRIREMANALRVAQQKQIDGTGKMWIQLAQGSAFAGAASGVIPKSAALITLGPWASGKILTSPSMTKLLIRGLRLPPSADVTARAIAGRLATFLQAYDVAENNTLGVEPQALGPLPQDLNQLVEGQLPPIDPIQGNAASQTVLPPQSFP